jgi:hypothetical protein
VPQRENPSGAGATVTGIATTDDEIVGPLDDGPSLL